MPEAKVFNGWPYSSNVKCIKPRKLFMQIKSKSYYERMVNIVLPDFAKTPALIDTAVLIALTKLVKPKTFFEFGTYLGIEILNIAENLPAPSKLYTFDFDKDSFKQAEGMDELDVSLSLEYLENEEKLAFFNTPHQKRITRLYGDSNKFDFTRFEGKMDMVYVDGGHDLRTLESDTKNAFKMLSSKSLSCIAWHDYYNQAYPQVTTYLDYISNEYEIYYVMQSQICFCLKNARADVIEILNK